MPLPQVKNRTKHTFTPRHASTRGSMVSPHHIWPRDTSTPPHTVAGLKLLPLAANVLQRC